MKTRVVQKAIVFNAQREMLMLRRTKGDTRRPGQWDLPGGLHEGDEELVAGIAREITEETGLSPSGLYPVYAKTEVRRWRDGKRIHTENVVFIFYTAEVESTAVELSSEHDEYQWGRIEDALEEFEYYLHKEAFQHILRNRLT